MSQRLFSTGACSPRRNWLVPGILAIAGTTLAIYAIHGSAADAMKILEKFKSDVIDFIEDMRL